MPDSLGNTEPDATTTVTVTVPEGYRVTCKRRPTVDAEDQRHGRDVGADIPGELHLAGDGEHSFHHIAIREMGSSAVVESWAILVPESGTWDLAELPRYDLGDASDGVSLANRVVSLETQVVELGDIATQDDPGLMSAEDKVKLDGLSVSVGQYSRLVVDGDWSAAFTEALRVSDSLIVPAGEYEVSELDIPDGKTIKGEPGAIIKLDDGSGSIIVNSGVEVEGVTFDGNGANRAGANETLIQITGPDVYLNNVVVTNARQRAIVVEIGADFTRLNACIVRDSGHIDNCNAFTLKASHLLVTGCQVLRHGNGHGFRTGRFPGSDPDVDTEHMSLIGCRVYDSEHNAFTTEYGSRHISLTNCVAENVPQAIKGEDAEDVTLLGCLFTNISLSTAWNMADVARGVYKGNQLTDSAGGVYLGAGSIFEGNVLTRVSDRSAVEGRRGATINGNHIVDCEVSSDYVIRCGSGGPGSVVSNNTIRNPNGPANLTVIGLIGSDATITGNVLVGTATRGVRVFSTAENYVIANNAMAGAETAVMDAGVGPKSVSGNV